MCVWLRRSLLSAQRFATCPVDLPPPILSFVVKGHSFAASSPFPFVLRRQIGILAAGGLGGGRERAREKLLKKAMEGKQLDFDAPLLSVRRFGPAPRPASPSSSSAAAVANSRAEVGGGGERPRRSFLPFYKSELKSGPVRNPGVVPFVWEQSPGRPKDGSSAGDSPARPAIAPKPPPGRISRRSADREKPISTDASDSANNGALPRRFSSISSSASTHTTAATAATTTTSTTTTSSARTVNGTLSKPLELESSREEPKGKVWTKPMVESDAPLSKERHSVKEEEDEEDDAFSDALDTLSRSESFFMNCSISGMSGGMEAREYSGSFSTDPEVRDFMMGRFLPAAQAMATGPPQGASRKTAVVPRHESPRRLVLGSGGELRRPAVPLPSQQRPGPASPYPRLTLTHQLDVASGEGGDDDDDEYDDAGGLPMKGCGFLPRFCLKSSFCLLNPVPGVKVRGRMPSPAVRRLSPHIRTSHQGSVGDAEDEHTWEEVYRHKLRREHQPLGEEGSKITSESNQLSYWSDSQTPDGSSPRRRSTAGGVSPYRNDTPPSPFHEGKGFLGIPKCDNRTGEDYAASESCTKDDGEYWEITPSLNSKHASGSQSPVIERTVYVDSVELLENTDSKLRSSVAKGTANCTDRNSKTGGKSKTIETSPMLGICKDNALQQKVPMVVDASELCSVDQSLEKKDNTADSRQNRVLDGLQSLKTDDQGDQGKNDDINLQSLLPPPLPKSPSESWLWRTLPSISSKNATPQSFLGIQFHPKKQVVAAQSSSTDPKWEAMVKTSMLSKSRVRFANALLKPANGD